MTKLNVFIIALSLISSKALAGPVTNPDLFVKIQFGEKISMISIAKNAAYYAIQLTTNSAPPRSKLIRPGDFMTIAAAFDKLPAGGPIPMDCNRFNISVIRNLAGSPPITKQSCFGVNSITSKDFVDFSNLLLLALGASN